MGGGGGTRGPWLAPAPAGRGTSLSPCRPGWVAEAWVPMETAGFRFRSRWAGSWGRGARTEDGQPAAPQRTPILLSLLMPPSHRICDAVPKPTHRLSVTPGRCVPVSGLRRGTSSREEARPGGRGCEGRRVHLMVVPWPGAERSVHLCVRACVPLHALCWGRVWGRGRKERQVRDQILQPSIWVCVH